MGAGLAFVALLALAPRTPIPVIANDNTRAAGVLRDGVLHVRLVAGVGRWTPEGPSGAQLDVEAFGEDTAALSVPGPLLRVPSKTTIQASLRNTLSAPLEVHGLCSRPGPCETVVVPVGETRDVELQLDIPGTYHYWATTSGASLELRTGPDSQLGGAIVVDNLETHSTRDRVFVISLAPRSSAPGVAVAALDHPVLGLNGRSWPYTEILEHSVGDTVRWRVINLSGDGHAMHLHGFHFALESEGNGTADTVHPRETQRNVVTQRVAPGGTFAMHWSPQRSGHWLFHCHMVPHMAAASENALAGSHRHDAEKTTPAWRVWS